MKTTSIFSASRFCAVVCLLFSVMLAPAVRGDVIAVNFTNTTGQTLGNPPFTLGFEFTVNSAITVTQLGLFDDSQNGLVESHAIGLWDDIGNLLVSSVIPSGTVATLDDKFRFVAVAPTNLAVGDYRIGAVFLTGLDALIFPGSATGFTTAAEITFGGPRFQFGATLSDPTLSGGTEPGYFGPNLQFTAVPEPATILLLGGALLGFGFARRRNRSA